MKVKLTHPLGLVLLCFASLSMLIVKLGAWS
jgi:hypothetical protein